mmetsp:Transcript_15077/g.22995  ORF Transcript_15077/g.22995 Transcript_15077/m.22995 type:complete len:246 (-) Transcript_15077:2059-2796(-)
MNPIEEEQSKHNDAFKLEASPEMCYYCFDVLVNELLDPNRCGKGPQSKLAALNPQYMEKLSESVQTPLFVTWEKRKSLDDYTLRGCIGTLSPRPLESAIGDYALNAAFKDRRFNPIGLHELSHLRVGVSLLVDYENCNHVFDWEVGVHGVIIKFTDPRDMMMYSATYLPEVAIEQKWDKAQTIDSLIRKAGYSSVIDEKFLESIRCRRYKSSKCRVSYQEYVVKVGSDPLLCNVTCDNKRWCVSM